MKTPPAGDQRTGQIRATAAYGYDAALILFTKSIKGHDIVSCSSDCDARIVEGIIGRFGFHRGYHLE